MIGKEIVRALRCISTVCNATDRNCPECGYFRKWFGCDADRLSKDAADLIERLTAENAALLEKVPQWISVEERRPELEVPVLVLDRRGNMIVRTLRRLVSDKEAVFRPDGLAPRKNITHWMPMPEAPEG